MVASDDSMLESAISSDNACGALDISGVALAKQFSTVVPKGPTWNLMVEPWLHRHTTAVPFLACPYQRVPTA